MTRIIFETLWFFLPAAVANMMPIFAARYNWLPHLNIPIDGGMRVASKQVLGRTKTWRGLLVGVASATAVGFIQYMLVITADWAAAISLVPYTDPLLAIILGALLGFGALFGDILKSLVKRRLGILPGKSWPVFDQIDYVIGASIVGVLLTPLAALHVIVAVIFFGVGSLLTSLVGVQTGIKKSI